MDGYKVGFNFCNSYLGLPKQLYSKIIPTQVKSPSCVMINKNLATELGLNFDDISTEYLAMILSGNKLLAGTQPLAQAYAGHQFGHFNILGDGRAILLGEHISLQDKHYDIQLKGSGPTSYSRRGDGRATLSSMLREYIISEAMHFLGIPTTRSLAVVATGEMVRRENLLPGAVLTRVASSHIRVGTFEYAAFLQDNNLLKELADYTIKRHYPETLEKLDFYISGNGNIYLDFLEEVIDKQAFLIAKWMNVGFIHGVMNTDNMLISGETIDYGPCAFMDRYDINTVFSSIDKNGRYAYANQVQIAKWNLARFAETLLPLIDPSHDKAIELSIDMINSFNEKFNSYWLSDMRKKLGLANEEDSDINLIDSLLEWMQKHGADYTNTFRNLASDTSIKSEIYQDNDFKSWYQTWQDRLKRNTKSFTEVYNLMNSVNPYIIPRNYLVEEALEKANQGDLSYMLRLLEALKNPFMQNYQFQDLAKTPILSSEGYKTFCGT